MAVNQPAHGLEKNFLTLFHDYGESPYLTTVLFSDTLTYQEFNNRFVFSWD